LAGCQKGVDRGLWDKKINSSGGMYNTNPIINEPVYFFNQFCANLYWVLRLFGKENIEHGQGQHA
tara:strand:+ start:160 stop:354 length:195 start_codon:yes stop_codon:yes gene_type:complete